MPIVIEGEELRDLGAVVSEAPAPEKDTFPSSLAKASTKRYTNEEVMDILSLRERGEGELFSSLLIQAADMQSPWAGK